MVVGWGHIYNGRGPQSWSPGVRADVLLALVVHGRVGACLPPCDPAFVPCPRPRHTGIPSAAALTEQAAAAVARVGRSKQGKRAAELLRGGDDGAAGCAGGGGGCVEVGRRGAARLWRVSVSAPASWQQDLSLICSGMRLHPSPSSQHLTPPPVPAPDAYAECYPSYYDMGTVMEDSDDEGARPVPEAQVRVARSMRSGAVDRAGLQAAVGRCASGRVQHHVAQRSACPHRGGLPCPVSLSSGAAGCNLASASSCRRLCIPPSPLP